MFTFSILIGIYSYIIFILGLSGVLTKSLVLSAFILLITSSLFILKNSHPVIPKLDKASRIILIALFAMACVNLVGALGPELGFDALWYHLTLPKIWLSEHLIRFLPGTVFRYSVMPKLTETLYTASVALGSAVPAKLIHFSFGILTLIPLYQISRKYLSLSLSLLVLLVFYSNLVVGWQSTTAYVDLVRNFFEILAFKLFLDKKIYHSAVILGLAVCVKLIALSSLPIFVILLISQKYKLNHLISFILITFLIPAPWFIHAFITTGNPVYPVFSPVYEKIIFSPKITDLWALFTSSPDPVSPVYIILFPLVFFIGRKLWSRGVIPIFLYCLFSLISWLILPRTGGGRFILPYLPVFSLAAVIIYNQIGDKLIKKTVITIMFIVFCSSLIYRFAANTKYLPVITGRQSQSEFLSRRLDFSSGNFFDIGGKLSEIIPPDNIVLVSGINNLYYADFKFIHEQYYSGEKVSWALIRYPDSSLIEKYSSILPIYENPDMRIRLYRL
jgi:hypothetical protein